MLEARYICVTTVISSDIAVVGGYDNASRQLYSVELLKSNRKTRLPDKRRCFCVCSFKQNLYIIGGKNSSFETLKSCLVYNIKCDKWSQIADVYVKRYESTCTIFEGKLLYLEV